MKQNRIGTASITEPLVARIRNHKSYLSHKPNNKQIFISVEKMVRKVSYPAC